MRKEVTGVSSHGNVEVIYRTAIDNHPTSYYHLIIPYFIFCLKINGSNRLLELKEIVHAKYTSSI